MEKIGGRGDDVVIQIRRSKGHKRKSSFILLVGIIPKNVSYENENFYTHLKTILYIQSYRNNP